MITKNFIFKEVTPHWEKYIGSKLFEYAVLNPGNNKYYFQKDTPREKYLDARLISYDNVSHDHKEFYSQKAHLHLNFLDEAEVIPVNNKLLF